MDTPWRRLVDRWQARRGYEWRVDFTYAEGRRVAYTRSLDPNTLAVMAVNLAPRWTLRVWHATSIP